MAPRSHGRLKLFENYRGCTDDQDRALDWQVLQAQMVLRTAVADLGEEIERARDPRGIVTVTGSALQRQFHTTRPQDILTIRGRLQRILLLVATGPGNFVCLSEKRCRDACGSDADACDTTPVSVCPAHFAADNHEGSITLIHEAAHQIGLGGDVYHWTRAYPKLTRAQAMFNADSYALFVWENSRGIVGPAPPAAQPAWTPADMWVFIYVGEPSSLYVGEPPIVGRKGEGATPTRPGLGVRDRLTGRASYFITWKDQGRPEPFTPPVVTLKIDMFRSEGEARRSGRPVHQFLRDDIDSKPRTVGGIVAISRAFDSGFDIRFSSDRGLVVISAAILDPDSGTRAESEARLAVRPESS